MILHLDIGTAFITAGLISFAVVSCMIVIACTRKTYGGFVRWAIASFFLAAGMVLIGLRAAVPELLSVTGGNAAILAAFVLIHDGMDAFLGRTTDRRLYLVPFAALLLPHAFFTFVDPNVNARILISTGIFGAGAVFIYTRDVRSAAAQYGRISLLPSGSIALTVLLLALFLHALFFQPPLESYLAAGGLQAVLVVGAFASAVVVVTGLVVLNSQRTERDLATALNEVKTLRGIIPICASCKRIRDDDGYWRAVETYVRAHTDAEFSHSLCPECSHRLYPELFPSKIEGAEPHGGDDGSTR